MISDDWIKWLLLFLHIVVKRTCGQVYANKACSWTKETKKAKEWNCSCEAVDDSTPCNSGVQTTISTVLVLFAVANTLQKVASRYIFRIWVFRSVDFEMFHFFTLLPCIIVLYKGLIVTAQRNSLYFFNMHGFLVFFFVRYVPIFDYNVRVVLHFWVSIYAYMCLVKTS